MNDFVAKKLGEVMAFAVLGNKTLEQGKEALLADVLSEDEFDRLKGLNETHQKKLEKFASEGGKSDVTLPKSDATVKKIGGMRDTYIGDEWDNATEIMEWMGFFEGAAIVHWALVSGAASALGNDELEELAEDAMTHHRQLLGSVEQYLRDNGSTRAEQ